MSKKSKINFGAKFMITYLCDKCGFDFALTEIDKPKCFYCESTKHWREIKRRKLTFKAIVDRMTLCNDRMMENLRKAYAVRGEEFDEDKLIETMLKGAKLGKSIKELGKKKESVKMKKKA